MADTHGPETPPPAAPKGGRRMVLFVVLGIILVVGLLIGVPALRYAQTHEDTDDAFLDADVVQIAPKIAGQVLKVHVLDNQPVRKGDLLVEIDPADYQVAYEAAQANLAQAEERQRSSRISVGLTRTTTGATVQEAQAGVQGAQDAVSAYQAATDTAASQARAADVAVQGARAKLAQTQQEVDTAHRNVQQQQAAIQASRAEEIRTATDVQRYQTLYRQDAVSQQLLDQAIAAARVAHSNLDAARVKIASLQSQMEEKTAGVAMAQAAVVQAQAQADTAHTQVVEAQSRTQQSRSAVDQAQARLANAQSAPEQVAVSRQQVKTVGADIQSARAAVAAAKLRLDYTRIYAPSDGRITKKTVEDGQVLQVGQSMMALVSTNVWVTANFKETQLEHMKPGQPVDIKVEAYPGKSFSGHVDSIQAGSGAAFSLLPPENATGNYVKVVQRVPVKIVFDKVPDDVTLGPGMSVVPSVTVHD